MPLFVIGKKGAKAPITTTTTTTTPKQQHLQNGKKDKKTSAKENVVLLPLLACLYFGGLSVQHVDIGVYSMWKSK